MTREKKELFKKLDEIDMFEEADLKLDGSGELGGVIIDHYDRLREPILNRLDDLMKGHLMDYMYKEYRLS